MSPKLPLQVRVRENAESVAFYGGDRREAELAGARLARVIATIFGKVRPCMQLSTGSVTFARFTLSPRGGWASKLSARF